MIFVSVEDIGRALSPKLKRGSYTKIPGSVGKRKTAAMGWYTERRAS